MVGLNSATPSSIISFVLDVEKKLSKRYLELAKENAEFNKVGEECIRDAEKLERIFKETVVELSLEPIQGFDVDELRREVDILLSLENRISATLNLISKLEKWYMSFSKAIVSISPEASMQLRKMAKSKEKQKKLLESLRG